MQYQAHHRPGERLCGGLQICRQGLCHASDLTFQAYEVFRSRRLIDSHGLMRGVKIPKSLLDVPLENLPFEELFYRYLARSGYSFTGSRLGYQGSKDSDPVYFDSETGEIPSA